MDSGDDTAEGVAGRSDSFRDLDEAADSAGDSVWEQEAAPISSRTARTVHTSRFTIVKTS